MNKQNNNMADAIQNQIDVLLAQRYELVHGTAGEGVYATVSHEERGNLYSALSSMVEALDVQRKAIIAQG